MGFLGPKRRISEKIFDFDEIDHPPGGPGHVSEKNIKKFKSKEPLFSLNSNFAESLRDPKYTFSKNLSSIRVFFAILCHFLAKLAKIGKISDTMEMSEIYLIYSLISEIRVI